ncbi:MAG: polymerase sigma-B factor [Solirubrobacteraceae bacterium]|jgi:RNA polymerase sigma-B factor|nr:polymerase sigma-B factor [Solirubrobacteraceae bacterium]
MLDVAERLPPTSASRTRSADKPRARSDRHLFARRDAGAPHSRDDLVEEFLPLAHSMARRYAHSGEPLEDLMQVASLALVKAIDRFDPARGVAFSSFAVPTILGELKRHFRDRSWTVRPPRDLQELSLRVDRMATRLSQQLDRAPTVPELAEALGSTDELVLEALQARSARGALSFEAPTGREGEQVALQDVFGASDDGFALAETRVVVDGLLAGLSQRNREILRMRFEEDLTQAEIGAEFGVSQMQVSRIIRQSLEQLRQFADEQRRLVDDRRRQLS